MTNEPSLGPVESIYDFTDGPNFILYSNVKYDSEGRIDMTTMNTWTRDHVDTTNPDDIAVWGDGLFQHMFFLEHSEYGFKLTTLVHVGWANGTPIEQPN